MKISHFSKHIFWSYNKNADLPENLVLKQVIVYGELDDLIKLPKLFNKKQIISALSSMEKRQAKRVNFIRKVFL